MPTTPSKFQGPKGTRDFYPEELLRRRYITEAWRAASIRHGFEEIDGPTYEHAALYTVKSGNAILNEVYGVFSGKDPNQRERLQQGGDAPFVLRPEFTPTLARLYAARASALPGKTRWFATPNFFRAERAQRGRLNEFLQWNLDILGVNDNNPANDDAEVIATLVSLLELLGLTSSHAKVRINNRAATADLLKALHIADDELDAAFILLDRRDRLNNEDLEALAYEFGITDITFLSFLKRPRIQESPADLAAALPEEAAEAGRAYIEAVETTEHTLRTMGLGAWSAADPSVVRGLAYYTGTVFEVIAAGERAVAGGGRYDNLIELFNGPPTPACGFGMGDVVLANLLNDNDLFPQGQDLLDAITNIVRTTSLRPEAFVISGGDADADALVTPLLATLRRGIEDDEFAGDPWSPKRYTTRPLHARTSDKATKNLKKLLADATKQFTRFAVIVHEKDKVQLKDFDARTDLTPADIYDKSDPAYNTPDFSADPDSPAYVGRAITTRLG